VGRFGIIDSVAGFFFRLPPDPSLAGLGRRTGATYAGRFDGVAANLLTQVRFRVAPRWPLQWHGAARWRLEQGSIGMLCEFSVQPLNGPRTRRLVGVVQHGYPLESVTDVLFMGPTRWEGPLEARLVPGHYRRCPLPDSLVASGVSGLTPDGAVPILPLLPSSLIPSFLMSEGNLLHCSREGAWCLLPDVARVPEREQALALLQAIAAITTPRLWQPPAGVMPIPVSV